MIRAVLYNLRSRALRTSLTVGGIAIGILALVVVGSLAERLQTIVGRSDALNANEIFAVSTGFGRESSVETADGLTRAARRIRTFGGVRDVVAEVIVPYGRVGGGDGDPARCPVVHRPGDRRRAGVRGRSGGKRRGNSARTACRN